MTDNKKNNPKSNQSNDSGKNQPKSQIGESVQQQENIKKAYELRPKIEPTKK